MRRCYIVGPMRGYPGLNWDAFDRAEVRGKAMGFEMINPASLDRANGVAAEDRVFSADEIRAFVRRDVDAIMSLRAEAGDAICVLPGWPASLGGTAEFHLARWLTLGILDAESFDPIEVTYEKPRQIVQRPLMDNFVERCVTGFCSL